jgi:ribosome-associated protein
MGKMAEYVTISDAIRIPLEEIELSAIRAQGAGGQHVNTASTAIHLRFDAKHSPSLPDDVRERLLALGDQRISADGIVVIKAQEFRVQERNRRAALERLAELVRSVLEPPRPRRLTRPRPAAQEQRLTDKHRRGQLKRDRGPVRED